MIRTSDCYDGPTVKGIDVSVYQGSHVDWAKVKAAGYVFGISRINDSVHPLDPTFQLNYANAKAAGMVVGSYQFMRPSSDPVAQAQTAVQALKTAGFVPGVHLPPVLDVERSDGMDDPKAIAAAMLQWIGYVEQQLGVHPIIYAGSFFASAVDPDPKFATYPLWTPCYGVQCARICPPWLHWTMWQYTSSSSVPGLQSNVDHNVFRGDINTFNAFVINSKIQC